MLARTQRFDPFWLCVGTAATLCVLLDALHVASGATYYTHPLVLGVAWWSPVLFGSASFVMLWATRLFRRSLELKPLAAPTALVIGDGLAFVTAYAATSFLGDAPIALAVTLTAFWAVRGASVPLWVAVWSIAAASAGLAAEVTLSYLGIFGYHRPDLFGIPWWLPTIYLHAGIFSARLDGLVASYTPNRWDR